MLISPKIGVEKMMRGAVALRWDASFGLIVTSVRFDPDEEGASRWQEYWGRRQRANASKTWSTALSCEFDKSELIHEAARLIVEEVTDSRIG